MTIKYFNITKEIMGKDAEKHGFVLTSHPALLATNPFAIFEREIDELHQSFSITEDLLHRGNVYLEGVWREKEILSYTDENSFRECIKKFAEKMRNEGYAVLDKRLDIPHYYKQDIEYVNLNYDKIAEEMIKKNSILLGDDLLNNIRTVRRLIEDTYDKDWNDVKKEILDISALMISIILMDERMSIQENKKSTYLRIVGIRSKYENICPMICVLDTYKFNDFDRFFLKRLEELL